MKKLIYSTLIALAGLFAVSCEQEHIEAIYNPENVTVQTLDRIPNTILFADEKPVTAMFDPAKFGIAVASNYALYASATEDFAEKNKMSATISFIDGVGFISMSHKDLNSMVFALGGIADEPFTIYFRLHAFATNDKGSPIESTEIVSNVVSAEFVAYATDIKDVDLYDHVWVIGASSAVGAWSFDKVFQYLYDYDKTGHNYSGVIDFGEDGPSGGFKLTGVGNWDDATKNWGSEAQAEDAETATVNIVDGGGSKDIKCYSKRYYGFSFDSSAKVLTKLFGFDNVGIVGAFNGWNAGDPDCKMTYNPYYHRFYIDWTFNEDTELKFTCDDSWDLNWGAGCVGGGDNIKVSAGSYRIYLDLNKNEIDFNAGMFGKDEPGGEEGGDEPEPETYKGWGMIGSFNDWAGDAAMTEAGGVWTGYITLAADAEWKLRKDADWAENFGGTFVALGEPFEAVAGGDNIKLGTDGFFKVVYDSNAGTITVFDGNVWSLIGAFNDWAGDVDMVEQEDGTWVSPATQISGEFKIRHNHDWTDNRGGNMAALGEAFDAVSGGDNIVVEDGLYKVTYDPANEKITVAPGKPENLWAIIGSVLGTSWDTDFYMEKDGDNWIYRNLVIEDGNEFKIRFNNDWGVNRGGSFEAINQPFAVTNDGANIAGVPAGTYNLIYNPAEETITVADTFPANIWSVIGSFATSNWSDDVKMTLKDGAMKLWVSDPFEMKAGDEFKVRFNRDWGINRGADVTLQYGMNATVSQDGPNMKAPEDGKYVVVYSEATESVFFQGWSIIGSIAGTSWDTDFAMTPVWDSDNATCIAWISDAFAYAEGNEFKLRYKSDWGVNRGGDMPGYAQNFAVSQDGPNIKAPEACSYIYVTYSVAEESVYVGRADWSIIGGFNGWAGDVVMFETNAGVYEATLKLAEASEVKIRKDRDWAVNRGGAMAALGEAFAVENNGANINLEAGEYDVCYDSVNETITISKL